MFPNLFAPRNVEFAECGLVSYWNNEFQQRKIIPTPLVSVSVFASVVHAVAQVEITQVYVNQENNPIETFYYFPLDSNGAVTHFHAEIEGRKIKGIVKSEDEAKAVYDTAVRNNQTAFLGEQNKPDIFKIRIGYLKPGTQVKIVIGYVTEVKNEKGSSKMRFFIPTTVAPRYIPPTENDEKGRDLANMNFSSNSPAQMSIQVNIVLQGTIKSVESPSHSIIVTEKGPVAEKINWSRSIVKLNGLTTDMDRDFVLVFTPEEIQKPKIYTEILEKEGKKSMAAMTYLIPSFQLDEQKTELIFLLDQSGSMGGNSIQLAKQALVLFLHSLPVDCYFNVVSFGSQFSSLFSNSMKYNELNLNSALFYARDTCANMGGTEIFSPLKHIYNLPNIPGYLRQIFVLTDGEVSNTEQVIGLTKIYAHRIRLFSLGIGHSASHHLVEGLASSGGGTSVFVTDNEPFESKVLQQLKNAVEPSLTDITVEWDGLPATTKEAVPEIPPVEVIVNTEKTLFGYRKPIGENPISSEIKAEEEPPYKQAPQKIPPIFDGSQMILFGIFEDKFPTGVTITADSPDGPLSIKIPLSDDNDVGPTGMLHKLAAIKIVKEMEMDMTALGILNIDYFPRNRRMTSEKLKSEIIKLSCSQGIVSRFTSFVAVDEQNTEASENWIMQTRNISSQIPRGYGGQFSFSAATNSTATIFGAPTVQPQQIFFRGHSRRYDDSFPDMGLSFINSESQFRGQSTFSFGSQMQPQSAPNFSLPLKTLSSGCGLQQQTSGLFGQPSGSQQPTTGLFGSQHPTSGLFGSQQPTSGLRRSQPPTFGSQPPTFGSQPPTFGSQPPTFGSQPLTFGSQPPTFGSQPTTFGSQPPTFGSQPTTFGSQPPTFGSQPTTFGSQLAKFGSDSQTLSSFENGPNVKAEDPLHKLISVQSFEGVFSLNDTLAFVIGKDLSLLTQVCAENQWDEKGWATSIAIVFLSEKLAERKEAWELVHKKAKKWLEKHHAVHLSSMLAAASKIIS